MTKGKRLLNFIKSTAWPLSSVDIISWGLREYYLRALRTTRELAADPNIPVRRIPNSEAVLRGLVKKGNRTVAFYEVEP